MTAGAPRILLAADFHLKYAAGLARGLADAGARTALLTREHGGEFGGDEDEMRFALDERLGGRVPAWMLPGRVRDAGAIGELVRLRERRRSFRPDVVHVQQAVGNDPRLVAVAGLRPGRYAVTVHDVQLHPGDATPPWVLLEADRRLARHAGLVFVHAEALVGEVREWSGTRAPVEVVPHGAHVPPAQPLPERPTVLAFGRMSAYKGIDVLLDAAATLWKRVPEARVVLSGEGELPAHPALEDARVEVRNEHVPEREIPALFADCTCAVLPYVEASQSGVGSRAKGYGRGLVVSDVGGLPELAAGGAGLVVPPRDPVALGEALASVLEDGQVAERLGAAARATLVDEASWDRVAERTLEAYRRHGLLH